MNRIEEAESLPATESEVVYHGPALDAEGGALEMKLITPKPSDQSSSEEDIAEAQRLMGII